MKLIDLQEARLHSPRYDNLWLVHLCNPDHIRESQEWLVMADSEGEAIDVALAGTMEYLYTEEDAENFARRVTDQYKEYIEWEGQEEADHWLNNVLETAREKHLVPGRAVWMDTYT